MARKKRKNLNKRQITLKALAKGLQFILKRRYFAWAGVCVLLVLTVVDHVAVARWLSGLDWVLVKDYMAVIITWPAAILTLGLIFMFKFSEPIRVFLSKIDRLKAVGVELSQQQATAPASSNDDGEQKVVEELGSKVDDGSVTFNRQQVEELRELIEIMDFKFLNLHLVQNTKNALRLMTQVEVRKTAFLQVYQVPSNVTDQAGERQAILAALFDADLIYEDNDVLKVTDKGQRFLKYIMMPLQQVA